MPASASAANRRDRPDAMAHPSHLVRHPRHDPVRGTTRHDRAVRAARQGRHGHGDRHSAARRRRTGLGPAGPSRGRGLGGRRLRGAAAALSRPHRRGAGRVFGDQPAFRRVARRPRDGPRTGPQPGGFGRPLARAAPWRWRSPRGRRRRTRRSCCARPSCRRNSAPARWFCRRRWRCTGAATPSSARATRKPCCGGWQRRAGPAASISTRIRATPSIRRRTPTRRRAASAS